MNSKTRFSNRVENYIKYRPSYPDSAINYIYESIGLGKNEIVADIGSGTGIFSRFLLRNGNTVYAVEPNKEMREAAERELSHNKNFISIQGSAEETMLEDNSIDTITSAQAFHWFNREKAKSEFKRILKPVHKVILIWNNRLTNADDFSIKYEELLKTYANDYQEVRHENIGGKELNYFFYDGKYSEKSFPNHQFFDYNGLLGRLLSSSYAPLPGEINYHQCITSLKNIYSKYNQGGFVKFNYDTVLYWGKI